MTVFPPPVTNPEGIAVAELVEDLASSLTFRMVAGDKGLSRRVIHPRIQKSGLVLVGHTHGVVPTRIQVLGETELSYLASLASEHRLKAARHLFSLRLSCVLVTRGAMPPAEFLDEAEKTGTPLLVCDERSSVAITAVHTLLDDRLAPRQQIHGVLVDVFEVGVLVLGSSGIGKSEAALELVMRGHRLVADDVVECDYRPPGMVFAEPASVLRHHIEVRGLGILDIKDLFGVTAVRERKRVDLVVRLELVSDPKIDRLGLEERTVELLGVPIREVSLPVRPGRNMSAIIEIAARSELLRRVGHDPSRELVERIDAQIKEGERRLPSSVPNVASARKGDQAALESSVPPPVKKRP